jgi:deoxyadenosine/deoxycytidine kinase/NTP pyrophosphatase (non-canonical NTP hydrolase)
MERSLPNKTTAQPFYIVIEGAIGVGKTTLARMLGEQLDTTLLLEVFEENPFLSRFYESRARYAFQTQMFFLLSRYRQQQQVGESLHRGSLIADYMFAKDKLFAQLNLAGDEWDVYQQLHSALSEHILSPDLVVYLQADTDVLMGRIAQRDRPYERDMERAYIEALRQAYEAFFGRYRATPTLRIDTNSLNFVTKPEDFRYILGQLQGYFQQGILQPLLPEMMEDAERETPRHEGYQLADFQRFHSQFDKAKGFIEDVYFNYLCLSEEVGELGSALAKLWREEAALEMTGMESKQARQTALVTQRLELQSELADCMAYLLKLANYANIDLETAYLEKMSENQQRDSP